MANTIEIILKAIDKASDIIRGVEQKATASNEAMAKSFEGVGIASDAVDSKLKSYGAALDDASRAQNQLKQAQFEAQEAAQKLAQAQYNLKQNTDPTKTEQFNKALIDAQVNLDRASKGVQDLSAQMRNNGVAVKEGAQGFESFSGKLVAIQAGVGIAKEALAGLKQVWDFAKEGAENQRIAQSFERTAKSIGADAGDIVKRLDEAAKGTVDDEELMQASTRALTLGVAKSGDDLVNVMKLARGAALQFGGDAGQAFESINQAIGNLAPRALKQYGIIVNLGEANKKYADSIGVSVDALTEEQQRQALLNEVLIQGAKNFGDVGNAATTTGEKMKVLETRAANYLDIAKEIVATGIGMALDITDAPKNAMEAFVNTAQKMRTDVAAGKMTVDDYNKGLHEMARTISPLVTGALAEAAYNSYKLDDSFAASTKGAYGLSGALDETARAARSSADAQAAEAVRQTQAKDAAQKHTEVMRAYSAQLLANVEAYQRTKINLADTTTLAIKYTEAQQSQAEVQAKLDELNQKIAARGPARTVSIAAESKATTGLTTANVELAKAQSAAEDVAKRDNETSAQYAMRLKDAQTNLKKFTDQIGTHVTATNVESKATTGLTIANAELTKAQAAAADVAKRDNESSAQYAMRLKDAQSNLKKLTDQVGLHTTAVSALSNVDQKSALQQAKLAAAQEDLATAQKKKGETDAEFILRIETIRSRIAEYSKTLEVHTGVVGGATKAELEQKKALEEQIATMQKAGEVDKAKGAFESLTKAFQDGILTEDQYKERVGALNTITGLYTKGALEEATAQEVLMKSLADPRSEAWRAQLIINKGAIDGIVESTDSATKATNNLKGAQAEAAKAPPPARAETRAEAVEIGGKKTAPSIEAAQANLDFIKANETAAKSAQSAIEQTSAAQEKASREAKGYTDYIAGGYGAIDNAISQTKQASADMTAAALKDSQDRSMAQEAESNQIKGNADRIAGAYKAIPPEITTTIRTVFPEAQGVAGDTIAERAEQLRKMNGATVETKVTADTTDATKKINTYLPIVTKIPPEKKTVAIMDTYAATLNTNNLLRLFGTIPSGIETLVDIVGNAIQDLEDILKAENELHDKTITIKVKTVNEGGGEQEGFQSGVNMLVPPSPTGRTGDYFPFLAAAGERVIVQTPAQQAAQQAAQDLRQNTQGVQQIIGGDTIIYNTNVYNPLAAAMLADKQRRDRIARSNARMGVNV
jgi:hypothetical protein